MEELYHIGSHSPDQATSWHRRDAVLHTDTIQLVESELPIGEASNFQELAGVFLFRQLCSPCSAFVECLFCCKRYPLMHRGGLAEHYYAWHGLTVVHCRAKFHENVLFAHAPPDLQEHAVLNLTCTLCAATLFTVTALRLHYFMNHGKEVRFLPQPEMVEKYSNFHCGTCGVSSDSFPTHCDHLYFKHNRMTYCCKYCKFCTSDPLKLCRHMTCHALHESGLNFQCPACSVYLRGTDVFIGHLRKNHALQIADTEWCCVHCYSFYEVHQDLLAHLSFCPTLWSSIKTSPQQFPAVTHGKSRRRNDRAEEDSWLQEVKRLRESLHVDRMDEKDAAVPNKEDSFNKECIIERIPTENSNKEHSADGLWVCGTCKFLFKSFNVLLIHMEICQALCSYCKVIYKCQSCSVTYSSEVKRFMESLHISNSDQRDAAVPSEDINKECTVEGIPREHSEKEDPGDVLVCGTCKIPFKSFDILLIHTEISKKLCSCGKVIYECQCCSVTYTSELKRLKESPHISSTDEIDAAVPNKSDASKKCIVKGIPTESSKEKHPGDVSSRSGTEKSMSSAEKTKASQNEQTSAFVHASHTDSGIRMVCGGCFVYFDSEDQFAEHHCTEKAF